MAEILTHCFKKSCLFCTRSRFGTNSSIRIYRKMPPPDRWENYSPLGKVIPGTSFIAFKVPLKEELLKKIDEKEKFSPAILIQTLENQGHKLGGIIDLTYTLKYYDKKEFVQNSIGHAKVFTKGHEVPSQDVFQRFAGAVKLFDKEGSLVGVHCTHGVNRTGYLICRYMIEELNMEPEIAIQLFNDARGHNLERENYLEDLKQRKKGESTCDPNYKFEEEKIHPEKERWRKNRSDHPNWRQSRDNHGETSSGNNANGFIETGLNGSHVPWGSGLRDPALQVYTHRHMNEGYDYSYPRYGYRNHYRYDDYRSNYNNNYSHHESDYDRSNYRPDRRPYDRREYHREDSSTYSRVPQKRRSGDIDYDSKKKKLEEGYEKPSGCDE